MRKVWTTLIMFSLFFLFSFSYAIEANVNYKASEGMNNLADYSIGTYTSDTIYNILVNYSLDTSNQNYVDSFNSLISEVKSLGYKYVVYYDPDNCKYYLIVNDLDCPNVEFVRFRDRITLLRSGNAEEIIIGYLFGAQRNAARCFKLYSDTQVGSLVGWQGAVSFILKSNVDIYDMTKVSDYYCYWNGSTFYYEASEQIDDGISMKNPLSDAEVKSILEIFLESVRNSDLPDHYGRYVLTYNNITGRYTGFVYPSYVNIGLKYCDFDENEKFYYIENSVGSYYFFVEHSEDTNYISQFLSALELGIKNPMLYEFKSNSDNTFFRFTNTYDFGTGYEDSFVLSTVDEPIIYTSHKLYSLLLTGTDFFGFGQYEVDENTSIDNQVFIDEATGLPSDNTLNEYTEEEENSDVNILSFIGLFFGFIFSLVSFVIRFFGFLVNFVFVPASTNILPPEFVQGIDWVHSFAFGDILLMDIFSIVFLVLLSIYLINLIREL